MSDPFADRPFPKQFLWAAAGLVGLSMVFTATAQMTGFGKTEFPPTAQVAEIYIEFIDREDGAVVARESESDEVIHVFPSGTNGFVRGVMRGFARERMMNSIGSEPPFRMVRWADGRVSIEDPETGRIVDVGAFGPDNYGAFAKLIEDVEPNSPAALETAQAEDLP